MTADLGAAKIEEALRADHSAKRTRRRPTLECGGLPPPLPKNVRLRMGIGFKARRVEMQLRINPPAPGAPRFKPQPLPAVTLNCKGGGKPPHSKASWRANNLAWRFALENAGGVGGYGKAAANRRTP